MRKEENRKDFKKLNRAMNEPETMDETDRLIMQALSDELSDITVSEELIARTLRAAEEQKTAGKERKENELKGAEEEKERKAAGKEKEEKKGKAAGENEKKKKARVYRIWGGVLTAAAALLIVVLGFGSMRLGDKDSSNEFSGSLAETNMTGGADGASGESAGSMESSAASESADIWNGKTENAWNDISCEEIQDWAAAEPENAAEVTTEGTEEEPFSGSGPAQETADGGAEADGLWLYDELLAAFDASGEMQQPGNAVEAKGETRSISWQRDGKTLSCVIREEDYRIEAVLEENGIRRELVLENWEYACELWELAGEE